MDTQTRGLLGGFSFSNIQGPVLTAGLIVLTALVFLTGHYMYFRDVAMF